MKPEDFCFPHITRTFSDVNAFRTAYTVSCLVATPFLLTSIVGNLIMLFCLWKCRSLHPPFKALLRSLVLSDLGVGLVVQPLFIASNYMALTENMSYFCVIQGVYNTVGYFIAGVSFTYNHNLYRFRQISGHSTAHTISPICYFEEDIHFPRIYLGFMRLFVVSVDLECSTSQNFQRHTLDLLYHYRMCLLHQGLHVGTSMSSRAQCQSSPRECSFSLRTLQENSH